MGTPYRRRFAGWSDNKRFCVQEGRATNGGNLPNRHSHSVAATHLRGGPSCPGHGRQTNFAPYTPIAIKECRFMSDVQSRDQQLYVKIAGVLMVACLLY